MIVMKFGGSSLSTPERVKRAVAIVREAVGKKDARAMVCSAFGGATDTLLEMGQRAASRDQSYRGLLAAFSKRHRDAATALLPEIAVQQLTPTLERMLDDLGDVLHGVYLIRELSPRTRDYVVAFGERLSATIIAAALRQDIATASYLDARDIIRTDERFGKARVDMDTTRGLIRRYFQQHPGPQVVTGYVGRAENGQTTTLGRGGSDYTVSILGAALGCQEIQVWTDVNGVMTADPRKVRRAFRVPRMTYEEAMEMSHFGAKVIYPPTVGPAMKARIPIVIKNSFEPENEGTRICSEDPQRPYPISGITSIERVAILQLKGTVMIGVEGISSRLFSILAEQKVEAILVSQASSEHSICFAVAPEMAVTVKQAVDEAFSLEILAGHIDPISVEEEMSIVAVVGVGMRHLPGVAAKVFNALASNQINVVAVAQGSSELNISFAIRAESETKALNVIHEAFYQSPAMTRVHLVGPGLIGKELLRQISERRDAIQKEYNREIRVVSIANSSKMAFSEKGFDLETWLADRPQAAPFDQKVYLDQILAMNLQGGVLVDCTASEATTTLYEPVLAAGISVVTPNKKAHTGTMARYQRLHQLARENGARFLYEATAGAGLPVINTLQALMSTGDKVIRIEAILSGTLSYLFNAFQPGMRFSTLVDDARAKGFTEPDPREDLSGTDVARKLLILARQAGYHREIEDFSVENLIPQSCRQAESSEAFLDQLAQEDQSFTARLEAARAKGHVLRYIATFEDGKGDIALRDVGPDHPCYHVRGSDNIVIYTTERYREQPLVITGRGAGADVTAAQVFAEIIQVAQRTT